MTLRELLAKMEQEQGLCDSEETLVIIQEAQNYLTKYDRICKIVRQNSHIPKYDSDVDAESFRRIRKVVLH